MTAALLFVLGYVWGNHHRHRNPDPLRIDGVLLNPALELPAFQLRDASGQMVDQHQMTTGWSLLATGDLARDSGQRALRRLLEIYNRIADEPELRAQVSLVLLDSGADPALARRTAMLTPALRILRASDGHASALLAALGADAGGSDVIYVVGPEGTLVALFPEDESGAAMAEDLKHLAAAPPP